MPQLLSLSRAARLAGVTRSELQKRLRESDTESFEGKVRTSDLLALYPDINIERDPVFDRIERLKQQARPKNEYSDGWMPDAEVLMTRLKEMNSVLVRTKAAHYAAEQVLQEVLVRLSSVPHDATRELREWLSAQMKAPSRSHSARAELFARDAFFKVLAPSIRIQDSGHEFYVEGRDTILEAALKAGLHLQYGCSSGNCGSCKARVVSGKVKQVREHDYLLSQRERETKHILACSWTAVTDTVLEAAEARGPKDLPLQEIRAAAKNIELLAPDLALLHVKTPRTQTLRFMAGQAVELSDEAGRSVHLPIASCPCDGRNLQFFVTDQGAQSFSASVFDNSLSDGTVQISGPEGDFVLQEESHAPVVLIAVDEGFAPIKSLIEHAISIDHAESMHLCIVGWAETVPRVHNACRAWRDALDNFFFDSLPAKAAPQAILKQIHLSLIHISEPTRLLRRSRMPSSA